MELHIWLVPNTQKSFKLKFILAPSLSSGFATINEITWKKKKKAILLHQMTFLMQPRLKPTTLGFQGRSIDHQTTAAQSDTSFTVKQMVFSALSFHLLVAQRHNSGWLTFTLFMNHTKMDKINLRAFSKGFLWENKINLWQLSPPLSLVFKYMLLKAKFITT